MVKSKMTGRPSRDLTKLGFTWLAQGQHVTAEKCFRAVLNMRLATQAERARARKGLSAALDGQFRSWEAEEVV